MKTLSHSLKTEFEAALSKWEDTYYHGSFTKEPVELIVKYYLQAAGVDFTHIYIYIPEDGKPNTVTVSVSRSRVGTIFSFTLSYVANDVNIIWSSGTWITDSMRGKGLSYVMQDIKEHIAKLNNVKALMAIVYENNEPELKVLKKRGWKILYLLSDQPKKCIFIKDLTY